MQDDNKKNQQRGKNEAKEQRRRRQGRQPAGPVMNKPEKQPNIIKEPEKPTYVPPGPEFYKNLKRETDEILKITEEANSKYKKKEIQSNWAKYEMPIESYEEIDEQENMGADYEKLIQVPMSAGGHFQFKHEKSWDTDTGPSLYDKYFDINMDLLTLAVSTIPFYERNIIEQSLFSENDIMTMNHRAMKYKKKYYNDTKYNTPEMEAQEKIQKSLIDHTDNDNVGILNDDNDQSSKVENVISENSLDINDMVELKKILEPIKSSPVKVIQDKKQDTVQDSKLLEEIGVTPDNNLEQIIFSPIKVSEEKENKLVEETKALEEITLTPKVTNTAGTMECIGENEILFDSEISDTNEIFINERKKDVKKHEPEVAEIKPKVTKEVTAPKNPVIESPEDLEKWLDDFLDG